MCRALYVLNYECHFDRREKSLCNINQSFFFPDSNDKVISLKDYKELFVVLRLKKNDKVCNFGFRVTGRIEFHIFTLSHYHIIKLTH